jgi:polyhydroxyalkanoate synthesis regulator phasin
MQSWRDIFLYAYDATERIDDLAADMAAKRKERMEEFRVRRQEAEARAKATWEEKRGEMKDRKREFIQDWIKEADIATKKDLSELKDLVEELSKKVDKLSKK